jgi:TATA-binding protein-associated factor Taf7
LASIELAKQLEDAEQSASLSSSSSSSSARANFAKSRTLTAGTLASLELAHQLHASDQQAQAAHRARLDVEEAATLAFLASEMDAERERDLAFAEAARLAAAEEEEDAVDEDGDEDEDEDETTYIHAVPTLPSLPVVGYKRRGRGYSGISSLHGIFKHGFFQFIDQNTFLSALLFILDGYQIF